MAQIRVMVNNYMPDQLAFYAMGTAASLPKGVAGALLALAAGHSPSTACATEAMPLLCCMSICHTTGLLTSLQIAWGLASLLAAYNFPHQSVRHLHSRGRDVHSPGGP